MVQKCPNCQSNCVLIDTIRNDIKWYKCLICLHTFFKNKGVELN